MRTALILLILAAIVLTLMYAAVVVASETDRQEREYWQERARQEGKKNSERT